MDFITKGFRMVMSNKLKQSGWRMREEFKRVRARPADSLVRAGVAMLVARATGDFADNIADRDYGKDPLLPVTLKAASSVTTSAAVAPQMVVADFIDSLAPQSAGAALLGMGLGLPASGGGVFQIPAVTASAGKADFVAEGGPIPVEQFDTSNSLFLNLKKIASISTFTRESLEHTTPLVEALVGNALRESMALSLDAKMLDANPGSDSRPPGLLNGISAGSESSNPDLIEALHEDLGTLIGTVGGVAGGNQICLVCAPVQGRRLKLRMANRGDLGFDVLLSSAVTERTVIALASNTLASALDPVPRIDVASQTVLNYDDSAPEDIATGGVLASGSTRSLFQADLLGLKLVLRVCWGLRSASGLAWLENTIW
jgi:hypothetical protein